MDSINIADILDDYWFDTDTARQLRDNFCNYVGDKGKTDISRSNDMDSGLGLSYGYLMNGPGNTFIDVWVQNAGCRRLTFYTSEVTCRVAINAIVNQCSPESTRKFGGSAAFGTCDEHHMRIGRNFVKFAKTVVNSSLSWNGTTANNTDVGLSVANISFVRTETNETRI